MGYQRGSPRGFDRPVKKKKRASKTGQAAALQHVKGSVDPTGDIVERTFSSLTNLGEQTFTEPPYGSHYGMWMRSLQTVLDDFEASQVNSVDEPFREDADRIILEVSAALEESKAREESLKAAMLRAQSSRELLRRAEQRHSASLKDLRERHGSKLSTLAREVENAKAMLEETTQDKAGLLERLTNAKKLREKELRVKLSAAEQRYAEAEEALSGEEAALNGEDARQLDELRDKSDEGRSESASIEAELGRDGSIEARRNAAEKLSTAVHALLGRGQTSPA